MIEENKLSVVPVDESLTKREILSAIGFSSIDNYEEIYKEVMITLKNLGLDYDKEQLYFLFNCSRRVLCRACPGSGKTTISQSKMFLLKRLFNFTKFDCMALVYNAHNVKDMGVKHSRTVKEYNRIYNQSLDEEINCSTIHSLARSLAEEYSNMYISGKGTEDFREAYSKIGFSKIELAKDYELKDYMEESFKTALTGSKLDHYVSEFETSLLLSLYSYSKETRLGIAKVIESEELELPDINPMVIYEAVTYFENMIKFFNKVTFSDYLDIIVRLAETSVTVRERLSGMFKVLIVDEYQDLSRVMIDFIKFLVDDKTYLTVIGDPFQSIYGFRGSFSKSILAFNDDFGEDAVTCTISTNRRSVSNVVNMSAYFLNRYFKDLNISFKSLKGEGIIRNLSFSDTANQFSILYKHLDQVKGKLNEVCVAYRNNQTAMILARNLYHNKIPFLIREDQIPYKDRLSSDLDSILRMLMKPAVEDLVKENLYKITPLNKEQVRKTVDSQSRITNSFFEMDFGVANAKIYLDVCYEVKKMISDNKTMIDIMKLLLPLFKKYYWNFVSNSMKFDPILEADILSSYLSPLPVLEYFSWRAELDEFFSGYKARDYGLHLKSMHKLKGTEYDIVHILDLTEGVIPSIKSREIESEVLLFYMSITRPRYELYLYWNEKDPSPFKDIIYDYFSESVFPNSTYENKEDNAPWLELEQSQTIDESEEVFEFLLEDDEVIEEINDSVVNSLAEENNVTTEIFTSRQISDKLSILKSLL